MFFFDRQDRFHHPPRRRISIAEIADDVAIAVDRDALGDQILLDHVERASSPSTYSAWLRLVRLSGAEVGFAAELDDAFGDLVGVPQLLVRVREELFGDGLRVDAARHEVVAPVTQHANDLGRQRIVEQLHHGVPVGCVALGYRAFFDVLARALAELLDVNCAACDAASFGMIPSGATF